MSAAVLSATVSAYPKVVDEVTTLKMVIEGRSIARYGDGEFRLLHAGWPPLCERGNPQLRRRLKEILVDSGECLVGIPNVRRRDNAKARLWDNYARYASFLTNRQYVSSFMSRPDSATWIDTSAYWNAVDTLWAGKNIVLVRGDNDKSLQLSDMESARSVREVICPTRDAFSQYAKILERVGTPETAILCAGPTATVLAVDLCARGVHAVDAGHIGWFLRHHRLGMPMVQPEKMRGRDEYGARW